MKVTKTAPSTLCRCSHLAATHRLGPRWDGVGDTRCRVESGCDCQAFVEQPWLGELRVVWMNGGRSLSAHRRYEKGPV